MNTCISILKGLFTIAYKAFLLCVYGVAKIIEVIAKAISDGVNENLKSK